MSAPRSRPWPISGSSELRAAVAAARAAGRFQRRHFRGQVSVAMKPDDTPVTIVDRESEAIVRRILARANPEIGFIGEESAQPPEASGPLHSGARWIVDPLDGTKKFVRGLPFFGPSVALERDGELILGVIDLPALRETLWAERGAGAYLNGEPISVSPERDPTRAYVVYDNEVGFYQRGWAATLQSLALSTYHNPGFLDLYSYALLASGRIDAVVMNGENPWDIAAAQVIIEEAGGRLTDFAGRRSVYSGTTLASNGTLHPALLELLKECR